jgi:hypothetical protein
MNLEQKILAASIRELNELIQIAMDTNQLNLAEANFGDLEDRKRRFGNNDPGTSNSGTKPHTN